METIHVQRQNAGSNYMQAYADIVENVYRPIFANFDNLTYIGTNVYIINNATLYDVVYQIKDYNYYFVLRDAGTYNTDARICTSLGITADYGSLTAALTYLGSNVRSDLSRFTWGSTYESVDFYLYTISDLSDNLNAIWVPNPSYGSKLYSQPVVFTTTAKGRDVVIQFTSSNNAINVFFLDDNTNTCYYVNQDTLQYSNDSDVVKLKFFPIVTTAGGANIVDCIDNNDFVRIFNNNFGSSYISGTYNNDSALIRKLINVNGTNYRQLATNFWFADPKGDETPVIWTT